MIDLFRPVERRSTLANPDSWLSDYFGGGSTKSGVRVNPGSALEWVFDAVQVRSQTLAALPLKLFRQKKNGDKELATAHPIYRLLHDQPHPELTSFEFRNMVNSHLDLRGNAYAQIIRDNGGRIRRLVPLHPDRVQVRRSREYTPDGLRPVSYEVTNDGFGGTQTLTSFDVLHLRGFTTDGICGISPVRLKAETIGLQMAANEHAARMFSNGARPVGVLEHPGKLGEDGRKNLRKSWEAIHGGVSNTGKVAILEEAMKFHEIGLSNQDAQLLESRKYSRTEIAAMYRVPPHMLGDLERATFSNIEQQSIEFVVHCMLPIVTNWEQRLSASLLTEDEQSEYFFRFNLAGLLRGDMKSRYEAYRIALGQQGQPGFVTRNEVRESEDLNRIEGGDDVFSGVAPEQNATNRSAIEPLLVDALGRAFRKEAKAVRAIVKKADATAELERFYGDHRRYLIEAMAPVLGAARKLGVELGQPEGVADAIVTASRSAITSGAEQEFILVTWETTRAATIANDLLAA